MIQPIKTLSERQQEDTDLYNRWKLNNDPNALSDLMDNLTPLIAKEVNRVSGTLPESALSAEAKYWTLRALDTYDPSKGAAIGTRVQSYLPKVRRMNYKFQNSARLPENIQRQYYEYNSAVQNLTDQLNRDPSDDEISKEVGWSPKKVKNIRTSLYADHFESGSDHLGDASSFSWDRIKLDYLKSQLSPEEVNLFENTHLPNEKLAQKLGVNINRLNYLKSKLRNKVTAVLKEFDEIE